VIGDQAIAERRRLRQVLGALFDLGEMSEVVVLERGVSLEKSQEERLCGGVFSARYERQRFR
jgi:hypothetical protein